VPHFVGLIVGCAVGEALVIFEFGVVFDRGQVEGFLEKPVEGGFDLRGGFRGSVFSFVNGE
jgi:hypothetical protein